MQVIVVTNACLANSINHSWHFIIGFYHRVSPKVLSGFCFGIKGSGIDQPQFHFLHLICGSSTSCFDCSNTLYEYKKYWISKQMNLWARGSNSIILNYILWLVNQVEISVSIGSLDWLLPTVGQIVKVVIMLLGISGPQYVLYFFFMLMNSLDYSSPRLLYSYDCVECVERWLIQVNDY